MKTEPIEFELAPFNKADGDLSPELDDDFRRRVVGVRINGVPVPLMLFEKLQHDIEALTSAAESLDRQNGVSEPVRLGVNKIRAACHADPKLPTLTGDEIIARVGGKRATMLEALRVFGVETGLYKPKRAARKVRTKVL